MNELKQFAEQFNARILEQLQKEREEVISPRHIAAQKYLKSITFGAIDALLEIQMYAGRWMEHYSNTLLLHSIPDVLQCMYAIAHLIERGHINSAKRELRYILELCLKCIHVDQVEPTTPLAGKIEYLHASVHRSSIDVVENIGLPFNKENNKLFKDDIKLLYSQMCKYVHPSKMQIDQQVVRYRSGVTANFISSSELEAINNLVFKIYDIVLVLAFQSFGPSMSGDLFIETFDKDIKWKYHKGKHTKKYSALFDYKMERKKNTI